MHPTMDDLLDTEQGADDQLPSSVLSSSSSFSSSSLGDSQSLATASSGGGGGGGGGSQPLSKLACIWCREHHIRCDRRLPACTACTQRGIACIQQAVPTSKKRARPSGTDLDLLKEELKRLKHENEILVQLTLSLQQNSQIQQQLQLHPQPNLLNNSNGVVSTATTTSTAASATASSSSGSSPDLAQSLASPVIPTCNSGSNGSNGGGNNINSNTNSNNNAQPSSSDATTQASPVRVTTKVLNMVSMMLLCRDHIIPDEQANILKKHLLDARVVSDELREFGSRELTSESDVALALFSLLALCGQISGDRVQAAEFIARAREMAGKRFDDMSYLTVFAFCNITQFFIGEGDFQRALIYCRLAHQNCRAKHYLKHTLVYRMCLHILCAFESKPYQQIHLRELDEYDTLVKTTDMCEKSQSHLLSKVSAPLTKLDIATLSDSVDELFEQQPPPSNYSKVPTALSNNAPLRDNVPFASSISASSSSMPPSSSTAPSSSSSSTFLSEKTATQLQLSDYFVMLKQAETTLYASAAAATRKEIVKLKVQLFLSCWYTTLLHRAGADDLALQWAEKLTALTQTKMFESAPVFMFFHLRIAFRLHQQYWQTCQQQLAIDYKALKSLAKRFPVAMPMFFEMHSFLMDKPELTHMTTQSDDIPQLERSNLTRLQVVQQQQQQQQFNTTSFLPSFSSQPPLPDSFGYAGNNHTESPSEWNPDMPSFPFDEMITFGGDEVPLADNLMEMLLNTQH